MSSVLWVGNLAAGVSDSDLRSLFEKFGGVENVTRYSLRNYAFVDMRNVVDARRVKDCLYGAVLYGHPLKIDFAKPAKPCKCLWVSGISTSISKEDLEEEFSIFGKIEDFRFKQEKNAAIIDYFKLEDATKALKAMHGKKKGGTTIRVDYSRSISARSIPPSEGRKRNEELPSTILCISYPPGVNLDEQMLHNTFILFGEIEKIESFPSRHCSLVEFRSMEEAIHAKNGIPGKLLNDPRISVTFAPAPNQSGIIGVRPVALVNEIPSLPPQVDVTAPSSFHGRLVPRGVAGSVRSMRPSAHPGPNFGGPDLPSNKMLSSPIASMNPLIKSTPARDVFDVSQTQREPKRLRSGGHTPIKEMNNHVLSDQTFRGGPRVNNGVPSNTGFTSRSDVDCMWRGLLARGGTPVCRARCVPIGDWIGYEMPKIVNCSARTGLDMLAKHYENAIGFDIVFFLPDSEEDFASYTEFLQYMGDRNRAGVAKFVDGTTLFLVPPSDFLKTVLNVSGPARLYGVVLKFPPHTSESLSSPTPAITQRNVDRVPPVTATSAAPAGLSSTPELVSSLASLAKVNSNGQQPNTSDHLSGPVITQRQVDRVPPVTATSTTPGGLSLTPQLVASLASLVKVNSNGQQPSGNTMPEPLLNERQFHGKIYEQETSNLTRDFMHSKKVKHPHLAVNKNSYTQDPYFNMPRHKEEAAPATVSRFQTSQGVEFALPKQVTQQHQADHPHESQSMVPGQQKLEFDADKNERYQSTLQLAANLLFQIQQKRSATETDRSH